MSEATLDLPNFTPWEQEHGAMPREAVDIVNPHVEQPKYEAMIEVLRREGPITYYPYDGDRNYDGFWIVTDNTLGSSTLSQASLYSSHGLAGRGGLMIHDLPPSMAMSRELMIMQDDPEHGDQRRLVARDFRGTNIAALEGFLRAKAHTLVRDAVDREEVDFVSAVAAPLPLAAIAEILSIPDEDRDLIYKQGNKITLVDNPRDEGAGMDMQASLDVMQAAKAIRHKIAAGEVQNPVLSALHKAIYSPHKGEEPSAEKLITSFQFDTFFVLLFLAGNETTRNSLAHGIQAFANNPDQWEMLKRDPELLEPAADEIVRWATPIRYVRRTAIQDTTLGEANVHEGEKVVVSLTGANRDPKIFKRPHEFDITRNPRTLKELLAFGHGTHFCLGRHLAKLEIQVVLQEMLDQVDKIELTGEIERSPSTLVNNIGVLPVRLEAA